MTLSERHAVRQEQVLGGIAAAIGFLEGVASRAAAGPTVDASIAHIGGIRGNLTDIIDPQSGAGRSGDRYRCATFWRIDRRRYGDPGKPLPLDKAVRHYVVGHLVGGGPCRRFLRKPGR